jgi:hypothetical protein
VVGAGDLVDHPMKIALNYFWGYLWLDLFVVLPLPQVYYLLPLRCMHINTFYLMNFYLKKSHSIIEMQVTLYHMVIKIN